MTWVKNLRVIVLVVASVSTKTWLWTHCSLLAWAEARYCVHADVVVVDILVKLLVFHEENPVEQFGGEIIEGSTEADDV